jgi:undecaprenyl-phosphate 4-deoxy-4-formamido-L-arabinose transferase
MHLEDKNTSRRCGPRGEECSIAVTLREHPGPISVVVPVYGDGGALGELATRLQHVLEPLAPWELILVNDGSPAPTWDLISELAASRPFIKALDLQHNAGQHTALLAGIRASTGDIVVTMDDDLQHPPEAIPVLLRHLRETGDDVVYGTPEAPVHGKRRQFGGSAARRIVAIVSGVPQARIVSAFRAFKGSLRPAFAMPEGRQVFIDGFLCRVPGHVGAVAVRHDPRRHGRSGYGLRRLIAVGVAMTAAFGMPRSRVILLMAAGAASIAAGVGVARRSWIHPLIAGVLSGAAIGLGCLLVAAGFGGMLLMKRSSARRGPSGYAIRTSINLEQT